MTKKKSLESKQQQLQKKNIKKSKIVHQYTIYILLYIFYIIFKRRLE